ncbi:hypothetical protein EJ02DRAFT_451606, partial [Clathrospora elynae]
MSLTWSHGHQQPAWARWLTSASLFSYPLSQEAMLSPLKIQEALTLIVENWWSPQVYTLVLKTDATNVTRHILHHVLNGNSKEVWLIKESFKNTFAMEAIAAVFVARLPSHCLGFPTSARFIGRRPFFLTPALSTAYSRPSSRSMSSNC